MNIFSPIRSLFSYGNPGISSAVQLSNWKSKSESELLEVKSVKWNCITATTPLRHDINVRSLPAKQALTSRAFWLRVGFGSGLTKKFGFRVGFGYWLYLAVLGCTGIRLHWAVLGCGGVGLMSLQMIHEAYIPVIMWLGIPWGPRGPKKNFL